MTTKKTLTIVRRLLEHYGARDLAKMLGYKTRLTIYGWLDRESVPDWVAPRIEQLYKELQTKTTEVA